MKKLIALLLAFTMIFAMVACSSNQSGTPSTEQETTEDTKAAETTADATTAEETADGEEQKFLVGLSQCTMNHPYRVAMVEENIAYAKENYPNMEIVATDGQNDAVKQSQDVEDLIAMGVDLLLISPLTSDGLTEAVQMAMDAGIPVVCLDRNVECDVTCFVWSDNVAMGANTADYLASLCDSTANIIEIQGTAGASATTDRHSGFADRIAEAYPDMQIVATQDCDYLGANAMTYMEDMLQRFGPGEITAVYAHNDAMAMGAIEAIQASGRGDEGILVFGMDGENTAIDYVQEGTMAATTVYPYCAPEGVQVAWNILTGGTQEKTFQCTPVLITPENVDQYVGTGIG